MTSDFDIEVRLLIEAIYLKYNYDFRSYSMGSVRRRVEQAVNHFRCGSVSELQARVIHDPDCFPQLLQYLTIPVSEMFRDPSYFRSLREKVIPILRTYPSIKIWIAGCSTGEEVYSLAILLHEENLLSRSIIYATDINPVSLKKAETGVYPIESVQKFTENYHKAGGRNSFADYYTAAYDSAVLDKSLRKHITFADHSLATDSVFSEVQMVSCRNVLIYFDRSLQDRAFGLFHEALCRKGFLGLGAKETVRFSKFGDRFDDFVREDRIFRKKAE